MTTNFYDLEGQKNRRNVINSLVTDYTLINFDEYGKWLGRDVNVWNGKDYNPNGRERLWYAASYIESGRPEAIKKANLIIKAFEFPFCHFAPMAALQLLIKYRDFLENDSISKLNSYLDSIWEHFLADDMDFVGVNDNFPCMSTFTVLAGGMLFHRDDLFNKGIYRLNQLKSMLTRRGVTTEFSSPTYTPIQVLALAEIANLIKNEEVRSLALQCEERLWVEILGRYHKETFQMAGPYSRAYTVDSTGHTHQARFVLFALLGDQMKVNPLNTLFISKSGQQGEVIHGCPEFMQVSNGWHANTDYHCPEYLVVWALNKTYPFEFKATTEFSSSSDASTSEAPRDPYKEDETYEYSSGCGIVSTYMTEDYALGISTNEFHNGIQTDSFHLLYRKNDSVEHQADIKTVYARYLINEKKPLLTNSLLGDDGRKIGIHHQNCALMLYKPKTCANEAIHSLKLSIILPAEYSQVEEIWLGNRKLKEFDAESVEPCPVFIRDGNVYMAFQPMILTDHGRKAAVKVETVNGFIMVSFYNYDGEKRDFAKRGLLLTGNGFAAEVRSSKEVESFEAFRNSFAKATMTDKLYSNVHTRQTFVRKSVYSREGLAIECEYSPVSEGIKYMSVNGKVSGNHPIAATGLDVTRLPFI